MVDGQAAGGELAGDGTDDPAGEGHEAQLFDGRTAHDLGTGHRGVELVDHDGGLEHEWSAAATGAHADGDGGGEGEAEPHRRDVGEVGGLGDGEAVRGESARGQHHEDDGGQSHHVDPVERIDPVDVGEPIVATGAAHLVERFGRCLEIDHS